MRKINISNDSRRDAEVAFGSTIHRQQPVYKTSNGKRSVNERRVRCTLMTTDEALLNQYGENLASVLVDSDPEVDMEQFGLKVEGLKKVYLTAQQKVAYGVTLNEHVYLPDGTEKEIHPETTTTANIAIDGFPLRWTGKLIPVMAKKLADADAMMLLGGGAKGNEPIVMAGGGTPYRAFLEGRVDGDKYALILRLTNMELKSVNN